MMLIDIIVAIVGLVFFSLLALNSEAKKERKKWNRRYNMRRGNFERIWK